VKKSALASADERFMRRAIALAERGIGETNPNPPVGCVLVRNGRVVGEGFHARAGSPHAEALALSMAGARARGATAYVTLEPCAPHPAKRTPPCAPRLIEAGVARVVLGVRDFNPSVRGEGVRLLRAAGVEVEEGVAGEAAARLTASGVPARMVHFSELWPFPQAAVADALEGTRKLVMVEMNATGQANRLLRQETGIKADHLVLKYDGTPFTPEDILRGLEGHA